MRRLLADGFLYLLSVAAPGAVGMMLLPFTTRLLGPREFGLVELCSALLLVATSIATLELPQGLARFLPEARSPAERRAIGATTLVFCTSSLAVAGLCVLLLAAFVPAFAGLLPGGPVIWIGAVLALVCSGAQAVAIRHLRWSLRPSLYFAAVLVASLSTAGLVVLFLLRWNRAASSVLCAQAGGSLCSLAFVVRVTKGELRPAWDGRVFRHLCSFSLPLVVSALGLLASSQTGRIMVARHIGLEDAGRFGLAMRISTILGLAASAFQMAVSPMIYARYGEPGSREWLASTMRMLAFLGLTAWMLISDLSHPIVALLAGPNYAAAAQLVPILCALLLLGCFMALLPGLELRGRTRTVAIVSLSTGASTILLTWLLLPRIGLLGAALAPLASAVLQAACLATLSQRNYAVPHAWPRLGGALVLASVLVLQGWLSPQLSGLLLAAKLFSDLCVALLIAWVLGIPVELRAWMAKNRRVPLG
jgi:O-antigen/teichoic acid export membrane protein